MRKAATHPLRTARTRYNLTIEQLAQETSMSTATIWRAEHNYSINAESRRRLCTYFGMTSQELGLAITPERGQKKLLTTRAASSSPTLAPAHLHELDHTNTYPRHEGHATHTTATPIATTPFQEQTGLWLILGASQLSSAFEQQWTPETLFESLHIVSQSLRGMPTSVHLALQHYGIGSLHLKEHMSASECFQLQESFTHSVNQAWQFSHASRPEQVLAVGHALRMLLDYIHTLLPPRIHAIFSASIYNLIGSALHHLDASEAEEQMYARAYAAASEAQDPWHQAQSRNWQAIAANFAGRYSRAIQYIEEAYRLIEELEGEEFLCSKAHLLANWAYNAAILQDYAIVQEKLEASGQLLKALTPNDEFDAATWHQIAGNCTLMNGRYNEAITHFEQSLAQFPEHWRSRRALTLIPLAEAYAKKREKEASLVIAQEAASEVHTLSSKMLMNRLLEYQHVLIEAFPRDPGVRKFIAHATPTR